MKELRCFLVEDVRRFERKHLKDKAALADQVDLLYSLLFPKSAYAVIYAWLGEAVKPET